MYKVLITTRTLYHEGSVHTVVAEFGTREDADKAVKIVNDQKSPVQTALALY